MRLDFGAHEALKRVTGAMCSQEWERPESDKWRRAAEGMQWIEFCYPEERLHRHATNEGVQEPKPIDDGGGTMLAHNVDHSLPLVRKPK